MQFLEKLLQFCRLVPLIWSFETNMLLRKLIISFSYKTVRSEIGQEKSVKRRRNQRIGVSRTRPSFRRSSKTARFRSHSGQVPRRSRKVMPYTRQNEASCLDPRRRHCDCFALGFSKRQTRRCGLAVHARAS